MRKQLSSSNFRTNFQITGSPIHRSTGRSTPPLRSKTGAITPSTPTAAMPNISGQGIQVKGVDNKLVQLIMDEIVEGGAHIKWSDIAGQDVSFVIRPLTAQFSR